MMILAGLSLPWVGAVILLTPAMNLPQAAARGFSRSSRLRRVARWLQLGWVLATTCALFDGLLGSPTGGAAGLISAGQWIGCIIGLTGLVVLSVLMERLAEWVRDMDAERMFNWAMWSWPIAMLLFIPIGFFMSNLSGFSGRRFVPTIIVILWIAAIGTFPYGLFLLSKSVTLAVVHAKEHEERSRRSQERQQRFYDRTGTRAANTEAEPNRVNPLSHTRPTGPGYSNVDERR
jgi:hypothetical protein